MESTESKILEIEQTSNVSSKTLLVVDDMDMNRFLLKQILMKNKNIIVIEAENGKDAIDKLQSNKVDLILMDIMMPVMGGVDSMYHIRNVIKSNVPIVAVTAYDNYLHILSCNENSFNEIVSKPYKSKTILDVIQKYIS